MHVKTTKPRELERTDTTFSDSVIYLDRFFQGKAESSTSPLSKKKVPGSHSFEKTCNDLPRFLMIQALGAKEIGSQN